MKAIFKVLLAVGSLTFGASVAHAQYTSGPSGTAVSGLGVQGPDSVVKINGDTSDRDAIAARDAALATAAKTPAAKPGRAVPARPEDVTIGAEVRDSRGALIGTIDSVTLATAIVDYSSGKVAIPLEAIGKNGAGLLVGMSKADFLKLAATAQ